MDSRIGIPPSHTNAPITCARVNAVGARIGEHTRRALYYVRMYGYVRVDKHVHVPSGIRIQYVLRGRMHKHQGCARMGADGRACACMSGHENDHGHGYGHGHGDGHGHGHCHEQEQHDAYTGAPPLWCAKDKECA